MISAWDGYGCTVPNSLRRPMPLSMAIVNMPIRSLAPGPDDRRPQDPAREALDIDDETAVDDVVGVAPVDVGVVDDDAPS